MSRLHQESGVRSQESGVRSQESGVRSQESGVRSQESGVRGHDNHEYGRRSAASALARLGKRSAAALPTLKAGLNDPDVNIRNSFETAIDWIENPKGRAADR
jgi:hypothetical protein